MYHGADEAVARGAAKSDCVIKNYMIIRNWHTYEIASLRDAVIGLVVNPQTTLRLSGVIEIMPLRGIIVAIADNQ